MDEIKLRNFIVFCGVGSLLEESGQTAEEVGFTDEECDRIEEIEDALLAPDGDFPPELFAVAKRMFRESLDALLAEVTLHPEN